MATVRVTYNLIAGQSVERIAALSDGVFAIAMTLLLIEVHPPKLAPAPAAFTETDLLRALAADGPQFLMFFMGFLTLGIFWLGQQTQLNHFERADRNLAWIHLAFLAAVSVVPFTTSLLGQFITYRTALLIYWLNILLLGICLIASVKYAYHHKLFKHEVTPDVIHAQKKRVIVYQGLYAFGAALCLVDTYTSISFIFAVQLLSALAPRLGFLSRF